MLYTKDDRSPRRVLHQGMGPKVGRDVRKGGSRVHKRHRITRTDDSDDSLLVDELDQGPAIPWGKAGSRSGPPWLFGGLDMHGTTTWGLNVAASGWGHQGDAFAALTSGIQTAGPSSKGGADIQPLQVDDSVSFEDIGGLSEYIDALKEMVFFPLLYPDFFASYHITPPRGVLLCGPPGTGKTLIARALASAASKAGQKVSFYMRKGADVLSKWVGEAERQLKLLFEEAQRNQPSIIFFDEIDGLAPVRSSKQEQIHNSIVSTLLALMDGLDSRGQVVLIGATNRIDAIDGALRRPGRFDRSVSAGGAGVIEECSNCGTKKGWVLHNVRYRATLRRFCTSCVLRIHPAYFCPFCFVFLDHNSHNTPPPNLLVSCSKCPSLSHSDCLPRPHDAAAAAFLCPPCASANPSYSFFQLDDRNKVLDKRLAAVLLCAANIAAASMSKAVVTSRAEAEQRVREAAFARKRARDALDRLVLLSNRSKSKTTPIAFNNGGLDRSIYAIYYMLN